MITGDDNPFQTLDEEAKNARDDGRVVDEDRILDAVELLRDENEVVVEGLDEKVDSIIDAATDPTDAPAPTAIEALRERLWERYEELEVRTMDAFDRQLVLEPEDIGEIAEPTGLIVEDGGERILISVQLDEPADILTAAERLGEESSTLWDEYTELMGGQTQSPKRFR